jgi:predicted amidohydrolase YtcJ
MRVVLSNANVIDCVQPRPLVGASVTVEHGRIVEVLEHNRSPNTHQAQVIDLHGAYLLPGLWDVHIHPDYFTAASTSAVEQTVQFGHRLMEALTESCGRRALCWLGLLHGRGLETRL